MIRQLIAPLVVAFVTFHAAQVGAQGAFPAPLPGQTAAPSSSPFPPVNGTAPPAVFGNAPAPASFPGAASQPFAAPPTQAGDDCMKNFLPLRAEAEKRGKMLKEAGEKRLGPEVACKIINEFTQAETKMIKYIDANAARCGIPAQIGEHLKKAHQGSEAMKAKICTAAQQAKNAPPAGPSLSDVLGSASTVVPETTAAKKGGGTFDTLSGNALTR